MSDNIVSGVELRDGNVVETVYYGSKTLCISSQAGCAVRCPFCASGMKGLARNLETSEFHEQVDFNLSAGYDVQRITISGIGEPLHNFDNVAQFIAESDLPVSVTTTGVIPNKLQQLMLLDHNGVMLSLHAGTSETHNKLIPVKSSLDDIFEAFGEAWSRLSGNKRRKIGFNYMLLSGWNENLDEIFAYCELVKDYPEAVTHLLVCNDVEGSDFRNVDDDVLQKVYEFIRSKGLNVRRANRWRREREGGCGTLRLNA